MAVPAVPTPAAGTLFANRFEMDRPVGAGGMGLVYRARDRYTGDWVALKVLHDSMAATSLQARFLKEAQILSELVHPHVVSYVAHGESPDGRRFLAMEWLEGQDLAQRLRQGPLDLQSALSLLEYVADGLAAAHQRGIIHRDIKPANLFLPNGDLEKVKILDFGVARRADMDASYTQTGTVIGTPEYMSPEQARGLRDLSAATDIFALGCVFHQCLTGKSPFAADSAASVLVRILFDEACCKKCSARNRSNGFLTLSPSLWRCAAYARRNRQGRPQSSAARSLYRAIRWPVGKGTRSSSVSSLSSPPTAIAKSPALSRPLALLPRRRSFRLCKRWGCGSRPSLGGRWS